MNWYYVEAGQQAGPVDDELLVSLVTSGKIQPDTLVWHEGMTAWTPYREIVAAQAPAGGVGEPPRPAGAAGGIICSECGRTFGADQVIRHGDRWVCAACKPIFLQRLREGIAGEGPRPPGGISEAELLARDYDVDVGGCISQGWNLFKANAGIMIGASVLVGLAMMAGQIIPYLGIILGLILNGPLFGGLWFFYVKTVRGQQAGINDAFSGFGPKFWQLVLAQIIPALIMFGFVLLVGGISALAIPSLSGTRGSGGVSAGGGVAISVLAIVIIVFVLVMLYLNVCWIFALPLVADKGLKFWPAMQLSKRIVTKHWWMTFWLLFVCYWLAILGLFGCCVGIIVTGPVAFAAVASHYDRVFGALAPAQKLSGT
jgi:uncharacterized membrane protein